MSEQQKVLRAEMKERTTGYLTAAFGLVAGLAWNDAIKALIEFLFPFSQSGSLLAKFMYAVLITIIVVVLSTYILKIHSYGKQA